MAKEGVPAWPTPHPAALMAKRVMAIPMGKEHLAIPSLRPMGEWLPLAKGRGPSLGGKAYGLRDIGGLGSR
jgi:hypothetical protein